MHSHFPITPLCLVLIRFSVSGILIQYLVSGVSEGFWSGFQWIFGPLLGGILVGCHGWKVDRFILLSRGVFLAKVFSRGCMSCLSLPSCFGILTF